MVTGVQETAITKKPRVLLLNLIELKSIILILVEFCVNQKARIMEKVTFMVNILY